MTVLHLNQAAALQSNLQKRNEEYIMKKKFFTALIATVVLCVSVFAGCAPREYEHKTTIDNPWWTTTGSLDKDSNGKVVYDNVTISLNTVVGGRDYAALMEMIGEFHDSHPGITVSVSNNIADENYGTQIPQNILNDINAPDLLMAHQKWYKNFAELKIIQPFDETLEAMGTTIDTGDYSATLSEYSDCGYPGYLFSVPMDGQSIVVLYNKTLMDKYELKIPTTHAELISVCDTVAKGENIVPIAWSFNETNRFFEKYAWPTCLAQNGVKFYDEHDGKPYRATWASDAENMKAVKDGIQSMRDFITHSPTIAKSDMGDSGAATAFINDKYLFYFVVPWDVSSALANYKNTYNLSDDALRKRVGATSMAGWFALDPTNENAETIFGDSHFFAMSKTVTDITKKAAICEFVKWMTQTTSAGVKWAEAGHINACTAVATDPVYMQNDFVATYMSKFYPDINNFRSVGTTPYYNVTFSELMALMSAVVTNSTAAQDEASIRLVEDNVNMQIDLAEM